MPECFNRASMRDRRRFPPKACGNDSAKKRFLDNLGLLTPRHHPDAGQIIQDQLAVFDFMTPEWILRDQQVAV